MYMTFISSLEGLFSSPLLNTLKVGFAENLICYASEAACGLVSCHDFCLSAVTVSNLNPSSTSPDSEGVFGRVPQSILDDESSHLVTAHESSLDLQNLHRISENAYKQYLKSRPNPSPESIRRVKSTDLSWMAVHPLLGQFG